MKQKIFSQFQRLIIKPSKIHGVGVFALTNIPKDDIIEICPVIVLKEPEELSKYCYFEESEKKFLLALGYGSLYNHADVPNCTWDCEDSYVRIKSLKTIEQGDELTINYGIDYFG